MRITYPLASAILVMSCGSAPEDKYPLVTEVVPTERNQEHGIEQGLLRFAQQRGMSISQDHYAQDFGCSNIYSIQDGEIVVRNAFGYDYEISAYASKKGGEARLAPLVKQMAAIIRSAPKSSRELC